MTRFDLVSAYYLLGSRYHSGQGSKGYRKLSQAVRLGFRPGPMFGARKGSEERNAAAAVLRVRRREIARTW